MSCDNCMKYRPDNWLDKKIFICPECGEIYVLAGVGPGNYWESKKDQDEERRVIAMEDKVRRLLKV